MKIGPIVVAMAAAVLVVAAAACGGGAAPAAQSGSQPAAQSSSGGGGGGAAPTAAPTVAPAAAPTQAPTALPTAPPKPAPTATAAPAPTAATSGIGDLISRAQATGDYTYDMKLDMTGMTTTGKVFVKGAKMRQEISVGPMSTVMLVDTSAKIAHTLMPDQKMAIKMDIAQVQGGGASPTDQVTGMPTDAKLAGSDTVDGKPATVYEYSKDGTTAKMWIWTEKGLPLKAEVNASGTAATMVFSNYQFKSLDAGLFQIPGDYKVMDMPTNMLPGGMPQLPPGVKP